MARVAVVKQSVQIIHVQLLFEEEDEVEEIQQHISVVWSNSASPPL